MSTSSLIEETSADVDPLVLAGLAFAAVIAWFQPFDRAYSALTFGVPALRAAGIVAMAAFGSRVGARIGLEWAPKGQRSALLFPVMAAMGVAVACAGVDWLFRGVLHARYVQVLTAAPLWMRLTGFMLRAVNENIIYRLFLGSTLAWLIGMIWKDRAGRPHAGAFLLAFAISQAANTWINVTSQAPVDAMAIVHDTLRYFLPGMVWSWIYWRRGFKANEIASTTVHIFFQPLVGALLAA